MIIIFIFFVLLSIGLALKKPTFFVIFYLLVSSKFLGFFDVEGVFVFGGIGVGTPTINIIALFTGLFSRGISKISKYALKFILIFLLFILYGILYPIILNFESASQAIIASKGFWSIFLLIYMIRKQHYININKIINAVQFIGVFLSLVYIIYLITGWGPPYYLFNRETTGGYLRGFYPTYISLAIFFYYLEWQQQKLNNMKFIIIFIVLLIGMLLAGHFALLLGTLLSLGIFYTFYSNYKISGGSIIKKVFLIFSILFLILISSAELRNRIDKSISLIVSGTDIALASRDIYNQFRWEAIEKRPLFGYGFINPLASVMSEVDYNKNNAFMRELSVIDSGYVDLLIRFGYVGIFFYLMLWGHMVFKVLFNYRKFQFIQAAMAFYIGQYFLINYTWSLFSYPHGLIPAFIAIFFILNKRISQYE